MEPKITVSHIVLLNITDQYTRQRYQYPEQTIITGILVGNRKENEIEIVTSFDVTPELDGPDLKGLNSEIINNKMALYVQIHPNTNIIGWYRSGPRREYDKVDVLIQEETFMKEQLIESPLLLIYAPDVRPAPGKTPFELFSYNSDKSHLLPVSFKVEGDESERIALDTLTKEPASLEKSAVTDNLQVFLQATACLRERLELLVNFLKANGEILRTRPSLAREIKELIQSYPREPSNARKEALVDDLLDTATLSLLSHVLASHRRISDVYNTVTEIATQNSRSRFHD
eukprot:TRINITY_DN3075_c0_g1_i1.p1 TRINITY_DN3075_c0_g1~~TRINITY_DN3075_c0_g1_i1.p1  ORF type:complete len:287 (+),score=64.07 TRINITY_DN3075_c0_g1_i1:216-1076(+)